MNRETATRRLGASIGAQLPPDSIVPIGGGPLRLAVAEGLVDSGIRVVDLGPVPASLVLFAQRRLDAAGRAVVSFNDERIRYAIGDEPLLECWPDRDPAFLGATDDAATPESRPPGKRVEYDIRGDYIAWLQATWPEAIDGGETILIDARHGPWSRLARTALQAVFPAMLFDEVDGDTTPWNVHALCDAVEREHAAFGVALDDDRLALVDGRGASLSPEETACRLLKSFGPSLEGETVVLDARLSDRLDAVVQELGAKAVRAKGDACSMQAASQEHDAPLAIGLDGVVRFRALAHADDALFTVCWLIDHLQQSGQTLAKIRKRCPRFFVTPELVVDCDDATFEDVVARVRGVWADHPTNEVDGLRITFPDGWLDVREHAGQLVIRCEAASPIAVQERILAFRDAVPSVGQDVWRCLNAAFHA